MPFFAAYKNYSECYEVLGALVKMQAKMRILDGVRSFMVALQPYPSDHKHRIKGFAQMPPPSLYSTKVLSIMGE